MITAANLQAAIKRVDARLLAGKRGCELAERLPQIAVALSVIMGDCCQDCGHAMTEADAVWCGDRYLCRPCAIGEMTDADRAVPTEPFMGSGERIIRKTGGLT